MFTKDKTISFVYKPLTLCKLIRPDWNKMRIKRKIKIKLKVLSKNRAYDVENLPNFGWHIFLRRSGTMCSMEALLVILKDLHHHFPTWAYIVDASRATSDDLFSLYWMEQLQQEVLTLTSVHWSHLFYLATVKCLDFTV